MQKKSIRNPCVWMFNTVGGDSKQKLNKHTLLIYSGL